MDVHLHQSLSFEENNTAQTNTNKQSSKWVQNENNHQQKTKGKMKKQLFHEVEREETNIREHDAKLSRNKTNKVLLDS